MLHMLFIDEHDLGFVPLTFRFQQGEHCHSHQKKSLDSLSFCVPPITTYQTVELVAKKVMIM